MSNIVFFHSACSQNRALSHSVISNLAFGAKKRRIPKRIILKRLAILRMRTGNFGFLYFEGMEDEISIPNIIVKYKNNKLKNTMETKKNNTTLQ